MKFLLTAAISLLTLVSAFAQFQPAEKPLTIIVSDGTDDGRNSALVTQNNVPKSYDQVSGKGGGAAARNTLVFNDPIRSLGMTECIQAAAFLERPVYGKRGFLLIFSINDAIGGQQATLVADDGRTYQGVYRLIRQKTDSNEAVPAGMTNYKVEGTFFLLGIS